MRLLDAGRDVLSERGVNGATVEEICACARFTRGAFYSNFADKEELVVEILRREQEEMLRRLAAAARLDTEEVGGDVLTILERFVADRPADRQYYLLRSELNLQAVREPEVGREFIAALDRFRDELAAMLVTIAGRAGRELTVDPRDAVDALLAVFERGAQLSLLQADGGRADAFTRRAFPPLLSAFTRPLS